VAAEEAGTGVDKRVNAAALGGCILGSVVLVMGGFVIVAQHLQLGWR
jgi:hypothetical protein